MFSLIILISRFLEKFYLRVSATEVSLQQKYLKQPVVYLSQSATHSLKACHSMIILNQVHSVFCSFIINAVLFKIGLHCLSIISGE